MKYQITLYEQKCVDEDTLSYAICLFDKDYIASVIYTTLVLSQNSFHFHGEDVENNLARVGVESCVLQEALKNAAGTVEATLPFDGMSRSDIIIFYKKQYPWLNGDITNSVSLFDDICNVIQMGVVSTAISLLQEGKTAHFVVRDRESIDVSLMREFIRVFNTLNDEEFAGVKRELCYKLKLLGSIYAPLVARVSKS